MATQVTAQIVRIYPLSTGGCFIKLPLKPPKRPKDGYFHLPKDHFNYKSLYALALLAAVHEYKVTIKTVEDINHTKYGEIKYMYVDW